MLRVECMPLDCGGTAIVVELDRMPERTWILLLHAVLRVECMPLDCGGTAIVVELDRMPERTW
ncbi:hypothetical protein C7E18_24590, partial [Stenotrophomonas maltophilia]